MSSFPQMATTAVLLLVTLPSALTARGADASASIVPVAHEKEPWFNKRNLYVRVNVSPHAPQFKQHYRRDWLVTDISVRPKTDSEEQNQTIWKRTRSAFPRDCVVGTYHSSRDIVVDNDHYYPDRAFPDTLVGDGETITAGEVRFADYSRRAVQRKLVKHLAHVAVERKAMFGTTVLFLDNVSDTRMWQVLQDREISWQDTTEYLRACRVACNASGVRMIANVAYAPGVGSDPKLLVDAADGIALEMPLLAAVGQNANHLAQAIEIYELWKSSNLLVIFIPKGNLESEVRFLTLLALLLDGPVVCVPEYMKLDFALHLAPGRLGSPTGEIQQEGTQLSRTFNGGTLTIDAAARTASIQYN